MRRKDREVTQMNEVEDIVKLCKTCHMAMVEDGRPYVVPLSFGYEIEDTNLILYFHSAKTGRKLEILHKNSNVCFEMACEGVPINSENPCDSGYCFSSIIGNGTVEFIEEVDEKCKALTLLMKHQADRDVVFNEKQAAPVCVYKIKSSDFSAKKKPMPNEN